MKFSGSHNEWDEVQEIVVGSAKGAVRSRIGLDQKAIEYAMVDNFDKFELGNFSQRTIDETEVDLEVLVTELKKLKITVKRPADIDQSIEFGTQDWQTDGFYNYCPRDSLLVVGEKIIEAPMTMRSRFLEQFAYKDMLIEYMKEGAQWFSAPKPRLLDSAYNLKKGELGLNNLEPVFDAANVLRAGNDLFYLVSSTGNELGAHWLQTVLGNDYKVNICRNIYDGIHIDSTIVLLRPGLVLLNPERVNENNLPEKLKKWDKIWCPKLKDNGDSAKYLLSSVWVGMNIFMVGPNLAIVDSIQTDLIKLLNQKKIDVLPLSLRHSRELGGGFHCVTLDVKRKSKLENYF